MIVTQTAPPAYLPLTLAETKLHLRVDDTDEDALIPVLIGAAVDTCQQLTGRSLMAQAWKLTIDEWADEIKLPWPQVQAVSGIQYWDENGDPQTLDTALYELSGATIYRADGATYPELWNGPAAVQISYTAGYSAGNEAAQQAAIPAGVKAWLLLTIGALYANRESVQTGVSVAALPDRFTDSLLDRFKVY